MTEKKLICLIGAKRSGKDTVANFLSYLYNFKHIKISNKLKQITQILFGFTPDQLETDKKEEIDNRWGISPRRALQFLGTEVFQYKINELLPSINRNFWVNDLFQNSDINSDINSNLLVVSDMRFIHEFEYFVSKFGREKIIIVKIIRPSNNLGENDTHISEHEYLNIPCDEVILNDKSVNELYSDIVQLVIRNNFNFNI